MRDRRLFVIGHGPKAATIAVGRNEHWVITEPASTGAFERYRAVDRTLGHNLVAVGESKQGHGHEARDSVGVLIEQRQQLVDVVVVAGVGSGEVGRLNPRRSIESIDEQAGVVGEYVRSSPGTLGCRPNAAWKGDRPHSRKSEFFA